MSSLACQHPPEVIPPDPDPVPGDTLSADTLVAPFVPTVGGAFPDPGDIYEIGTLPWPGATAFRVYDTCQTALWPVMCGNLDGCPEVWDDVSELGPVFNPWDPCEIAYLRMPGTDYTNVSLWYLNLCTGERRFLASQVAGSASWGPRGHLVFSSYGAIWRIHVSGDSLVRLITPPVWPAVSGSPFYMRPGYSPDGSRIAFHVADRGIWVADAAGRIQDSLPLAGPMSPNVIWDKSGDKIICGIGSGIGVVELSTKQVVQISNIPFILGQLQGVCLSPDGRYLYSIGRIDAPGQVPATPFHIWKTDLTTDVHTIVVPEISRCINKTYHSPSLSPGGHWMITQVSYKRYLGDRLFYRDFRLALIRLPNGQAWMGEYE
ncbi:MAG: hypothetical protein SF053_09570 [Bacteroidia bacterium]|nr:hypothetical protein [Bacteroidia bacterium]